MDLNRRSSSIIFSTRSRSSQQSIAAATAVLALAGTTEGKTLRMPIKRNEPTAANIANGKVRAALERKYNLGKSTTIPVSDMETAIWYAPGEFGTYSNSNTGVFQLIFDTGSSNLLLPDVNCGLSCGLHPRYDPGSSTTSKSIPGNFSIEYASGTVSGVMGSDDFTVGTLKVVNQAALLGTDWSGLPTYDLEPFDGILGLAFSRISVNNQTTWAENLAASGLLDEDTFYFNYVNASSAEIVIGEVDPNHFNQPLTTVPLSYNIYYNTPFQSYKIGDTQYSDGTGVLAIFDSGTSVTTVPTSWMPKIVAQLGASALFNGEYSVPCNSLDTLPNLVFTVGNVDYTLTPTQYTISDEGVICLLGIIGLDIELPDPQNPTQMTYQGMIMGDVFLRSYTVAYNFDPKNASVSIEAP